MHLPQILDLHIDHAHVLDCRVLMLPPHCDLDDTTRNDEAQTQCSWFCGVCAANLLCEISAAFFGGIWHGLWVWHVGWYMSRGHGRSSIRESHSYLLQNLSCTLIIYFSTYFEYMPGQQQLIMWHLRQRLQLMRFFLLDVLSTNTGRVCALILPLQCLNIHKSTAVHHADIYISDSSIVN